MTDNDVVTVGILGFLLVIGVFIFWLEKEYYAKKQKRLMKIDRGEQVRENYDPNEDNKYIYVPNLKIWAFSIIVGLVIVLVPLIYILMNKIYNVPNYKYRACHLGGLVAWHYVTQIFFMIFIVGILSLVAYMIIKISKDE